MMLFLSYVKNRYISAKIIMEFVALAVKSGWVGGNGNIFISIFLADGLGFGADLQAKLEQEILFVKIEW